MKINSITEQNDLNYLSWHKKLINIRNNVQPGADKSGSKPGYTTTGKYHPAIEGWNWQHKC